MPKISVITINLNNKEGLCKTIESVVSQTFTDYEYIIIDGGSMDGSVDVIKEYSDKITYLVSEPDKGIYNAMNKGILNAHGEYFQFLNSGDEYTSSFALEIALNCITRKELNVNLIFFDYIYRSSSEVRLVTSNDVLDKYVLRKKGFGHLSTFYRGTIFDKVGLFEESFSCSGDRDFYMKALLRHGEAFSYFCFAVAIFYEGGLSTDKKYSNIIGKEDTKIMYEYYTKFERALLKIKIFNRLINKKFTGEVLMRALGWELKRL